MQEQVKDEKDPCGICLEEADYEQRGFLRQCDHIFHYECIFKWSQVTNLCPACKIEFTGITKRNSQGETTHFQEVKPATQKHTQEDDPNSLRELIERCACCICGEGDREHILLLCELCNVACHTDCIGLNEVPQGPWYCEFCRDSRNRAPRASSHVLRASTVATRRRNRSVVPVISEEARRRRRSRMNFEARVGFSRNPRRAESDIAANVPRRLRGPMSTSEEDPSIQEVRQLNRLQMCANALASTSHSSRAQMNTRVCNDQPPAMAQNSTGTSDTEVMWNEMRASRNMMNTASNSSSTTIEQQAGKKRKLRVDGSTSSSGISRAEAKHHLEEGSTPDYLREAKQLFAQMKRASAVDEKAKLSGQSMTSKLSMLSKVRNFFRSCSRAEKEMLLENGCLKVLYDWLQPLQHATISQTVLCILSTLPVSRKNLKECSGLGRIVLHFCISTDENPENMRLAQRLIEDWSKFALKKPLNSNAMLQRKSQMVGTSSSQGQPSEKKAKPFVHQVEKSTELKNVARNYVKRCLMWYFDRNQLTRDQFKRIAQHVTTMICSMKMNGIHTNGTINDSCKQKIKKIIHDQVKAKYSFSNYSAQLK